MKFAYRPLALQSLQVEQEKSMAGSQSAAKCVRCVLFIINVTTFYVTATVQASKGLPWR